jgi:hypothetical protein
MKAIIDRLKLIFLGVFAFTSVGIVIYQVGWALPRQACETKGDWWDWRGRTCAHPILISDITGRVIDNKQIREAAKAAAAESRAKAAPAVAPKP